MGRILRFLFPAVGEHCVFCACPVFPADEAVRTPRDDGSVDWWHLYCRDQVVAEHRNPSVAARMQRRGWVVIRPQHGGSTGYDAEWPTTE